MKKGLYVICAMLACSCLLMNDNIQASEPPVRIDRNDGGHHIGGTNVTFSYQLFRTNYNPVTEKVQYKLGQFFTIQGSPILILSDYVYLTNNATNNEYIGFFDKYNGTRPAGTYTRDKWLTLTLVPGRNVITIRGDSSGVAGTGDAQYVIDIDRFGHDPVVHGVNGTWVSGEVSSGKRTWQSLYTDGATGSVEGNQTPTSTGFFYSDVDEQPDQVPSYWSVPLSTNARLTEIQKQNTDGSWTGLPTANWTEMDKAGLYWLKACTTDQAGNTTCGTRYVNVEQKQYEVKYNGNGATSGTMSNSSHIYDEPKNLTANSYAKTGYYFHEWNTKSDGTGARYANREFVFNLTNVHMATVNLYAQWLPNTYYVKYNGNGATFGSTPISHHIYDETKALSKNGFNRTGWKFMGWNTKADGSGTRYIDKQSVKNLTSTHKATVNLYAQWNQAPSLTVKDHTYYDNEITQVQWQSTLRLKGIKAHDREDGNLTSKIKVKEDLAEVNKPGRYPITYEVTDSVGQTAQKTAYVNILYNHPPVITAKSKVYHENELTAEQWQEEIKKDVSGSDQEDGNVTDKIEVIKDTVNPSVPGAYEVTYKVTDSMGKSTEKTIDVTILENWKPVLQIFASSHRFIEGQYTQLQWENEIRKIGVSAHDKEDHDLMDKVEVIKDTTKPSVRGFYKVTYKVTDRWGKSAEKTVNVIVEPNEAPEIFAYDKYFTTKDLITEQDLLKNVIAIDDRDGDISDDLEIISSTIEVGKVGIYEVTYRVSDQFGKTTEKTVKVHISEKGTEPTPPQIPSTSPNALQLWNGREFAQITITKEMETSLFDQNAYKDVVFGVYAGEDITYHGEVVLTKDSLIGLGKVDENKQVHVMIYHAGNYYLKELSTNGRYVLDDTKYYFEFSYDD